MGNPAKVHFTDFRCKMGDTLPGKLGRLIDKAGLSVRAYELVSVK